MPAILALDLGTRTGWALAEHGRVESGVHVFDVQRGESPGMRAGDGRAQGISLAGGFTVTGLRCPLAQRQIGAGQSKRRGGAMRDCRRHRCEPQALAPASS